MKLFPVFLQNLNQFKHINKGRGSGKAFGWKEFVAHMGSWFSLRTSLFIVRASE